MKNRKLYLLIISILLFTGCAETSGETDTSSAASETTARTSTVTSQTTAAFSTPEEKNEYADEFIRTFEKMKSAYTLAEYKGVDLDTLYEEHLPSFETCANLEEYYAAWMDLCNDIPDGHVYVTAKTKEENVGMRRTFMENRLGLDYGFCLVTASDGGVMFVCTDENGSAYSQCIRDGMKLVSINGTDVAIAKSRSEVLENVSDNFNRSFLSSLYITCNCGENIDIIYEDESGQQRTASVKGEGTLYDRYDMAHSGLLYSKDDKENLSVEILIDDVGVLYFNDVLIASSNGLNNEGDYKSLKSDLKQKLLSLKEQGADKLIIDMRGNGGGYREAAAAVASLFTDEAVFCSAYDAPPDVMEQIVCPFDCYTTADNAWGDGQIVILVNSNTASAAELFIHTMKKLPNVTTMGFTNSRGCAMGVFAIQLNELRLSYPTCRNIDENKEIIIDADKSGDMKLPVDVRIPMTKDAIKSIYTDKTDYMMSYAITYLEG